MKICKKQQPKTPVSLLGYYASLCPEMVKVSKFGKADIEEIDLTRFTDVDIDLFEYEVPDRISILTSIGCPNDCSYCHIPNTEGKNKAYRDPIDVVNYIQKINPQSKKQIYSIYREMIPKKKTYLKYIKNENKRNYQELAEYVAEYLECSLGEADEYIDILQEHGVRGILWKMGVDDDETEKLIKKAKL